VLDTGASNHMFGSRVAFSDIDGRTIGTMKFVDGSVVYIEGVGTVLYQCRNGEHRALNNVYFIHRPMTSIISVGQLDEDGHEVNIKHGMLSIRGEDQRLLTKIQHNPRRLYKLEIKIAQPGYLSTSDMACEI
jgi:hypothetical protein